MFKILSGNWKSSLLAHSLWHFYNHELYCTVRADDGEPNRHRIDGIRGPDTIDTIRVCISIRDNDRWEEGLVHELLHANLIPLGYPRFWIEEHAAEKWRLAKGITNLADHVVMRPIYASLGYSNERFLGPTRSLNERARRVDADLKDREERLRTPQGYLNCVSQYLAQKRYTFYAASLSGRCRRATIWRIERLGCDFPKHR
jgi:hypothetical protein